MATNIAAFLKLLQLSENYPHEPTAKNYNTMYGGGTLENLNDHPHRTVTKWGHTSSAAGAYQITADTYDEFKKKLHLKDFSAEAQDKIATEIIKTENALDLISDGKIEDAIKKLNRRWVSLPGGKQARIKLDEALRKFAAYQQQ
ncbi:MAG: glycoside hydrolase family 104 protein [Acidobacteriota bacterium]|nr:glycoside hydrolase family 104 protein [Acidobacteriota bacterium]